MSLKEMAGLGSVTTKDWPPVLGRMLDGWDCSRRRCS